MRKIIVILLLIGLLSTVPLTVSKPLQTPTSTTTDDGWPMLRHDPEHTATTTSRAPYTNTVHWTTPLGDRIIGSPSVVDNKVFVGAANGNLYCLDSENGEELWRFTTENTIRDSSPAIADGNVYFGSDDGNLYCLYTNNGTEKWSYHMASAVWSSPTVVDGRVYVGSNGNKIYCLDAESGDELWNYPTSNVVDSSPAVVNGRVYIGCWDGRVYCLDAQTGERLWFYQTDDWVVSSPTIAYGRVYVGSKDCNIYCLDAQTGEKLWERTTGYWVYSSPAVYQGKVYIGAFEEYPGTGGSFLCLNATTGHPVWWYNETNDWVVSSPAIADGKVYFGCHDDKVYCLDATYGSTIWVYQTGGFIKSSPAIAHDKMYIGSSDGTLYCFYDGGITPQVQIGKITGPLGVNVTISNTGTIDVHNMKWTIAFDGGLILVPREKLVTGTLYTFYAGEHVKLQTNVFGLGITTTTVTLEIPGLEPLTQTARALMLGPFMIFLPTT